MRDPDALRALQLRLDLFCKLGELLQDVDRLVGVVGGLEARSRLLEPRQQIFRLVQRLISVGHAASSRWIRPRMPFTSLAPSSDA